MERRYSDLAFEEFWKSYPRRVGKIAAKREWDRIRPTPEVVEQIAKALDWQREQWDDPQYIPHPRTWLHQGRWLDEPSVPVVKQQKPSGALANVIDYMNRREGTHG